MIIEGPHSEEEDTVEDQATYELGAVGQIDEEAHVDRRLRREEYVTLFGEQIIILGEG